MEQRDSKSTEPSLKGTFASVMLLAAFLIVTWVGVLWLFVARG
ncbi:cytochrome c oxidase subunit 2A [Paenibacillus sp. NPDC056579]|nr:cytochrome c oxidase subunit 2A [Paenibacillus sp. H1-7]ULL18020.1 cytochrome c oxidase subunit 2A [Paenibacillus sp. H1-7]